MQVALCRDCGRSTFLPAGQRLARRLTPFAEPCPHCQSVRTHRKSERRRYCLDCSRQFLIAERGSLLMPSRYRQFDRTKLFCPRCFSSFIVQWHTRQRPRSGPTRVFKCRGCGRSFRERYAPADYRCWRNPANGLAQLQAADFLAWEVRKYAVDHPLIRSGVRSAH